jgi:hypothetical protein
LKRLGLTAESIRKHVVRIEPPLPKWSSKLHAARLAAGLTYEGKVRQRKYVKRES